MMKKSIVIGFWAALAFIVNPLMSNTYVVEGVISFPFATTYERQMVYMYDIVTRKNTDSTWVRNGRFTFAGSVDEPVFRRLVLGRQLSVDFILENGTISVDMTNWRSAKGTPLNDELSKYRTEMIVYHTDIQNTGAIQQLLQRTQFLDAFEIILQRQQGEKFKQHRNSIDLLNARLFNENKDNALGAYILWNWSLYLEPENLESLFAQAGDVVRNFTPLKNIIEINAKIRQLAVGMPFIDFTIENGNIDGSSVSLSDFVGRGKYVLVDFWASWCGPCLAEKPNLIEVYNKFKGDKFEILGVAVRERREATMNYLEKNNSLWPQIIDAGDTPLSLYGISGIPHIILFDPDGKIVARNLRGDQLRTKVARVLTSLNY